MKNLRWVKVLIGVIVLVIVIEFLYHFVHKPSTTLKNAQIQTYSVTTPTPRSNQPLVQTIISSPTPVPVPSTNTSQTPATSQGYGGHVTCNYQIPAAPGQYGTAVINSSWQNASLDKTGTAKVDLCVTPSGKPATVIATDSKKSGSRTDTASWIAVDVNYMFGLYDEHGGDISDCSGIPLSTCQINSND